jgi:hypothetical protein
MHACMVEQVHGHSATCKKGKIGHVMCRMARQQSCVEQTCAVQLDTSQKPPSSDPATLHRDCTWQPTILPKLQPMLSCWQRRLGKPAKVQMVPAMLPDARVLKVEVLRPSIKATLQELASHIARYCSKHDLIPDKDFVAAGGEDGLIRKLLPRLERRNGYVVEVNDVMSAATRCNTNAQWLGTMHDSQTAMRYLASYMDKNKTDPSRLLKLLATVRRQILSTHKSKADDAGTPGRTSKHMIARMHNMALGRQELAATQCALFLLQTPTFLTTEQFRKLHYTCARDHIIKHRQQQSHEANGSDARGSDVEDAACANTDSDDMDLDHETLYEENIDNWYSAKKKQKGSGKYTAASFGSIPRYDISSKANSDKNDSSKFAPFALSSSLFLSPLPHFDASPHSLPSPLSLPCLLLFPYCPCSFSRFHLPLPPIPVSSPSPPCVSCAATLFALSRRCFCSIPLSSMKHDVI